MRHRSPKPGTPLDEKQSELSRRESEVREKMQKLEQMIADAPKMAEEVSRRQREELVARASEGGARLDVSMALSDKRYSDAVKYSGRRTSLRKERREGRLIFLVLVIALAGVIIWLVTHLPF